ncbi:hypothetical protein J2Z83_000537 [Virgibacillus natechei]|uniref:Membrane-associated protein n=1 Tax=Virgibacillus natechei TaxID=1216297 RepID=A0ABS4IC24_9BACI|nr:hypothetical protein [Virgibacillus natechei]MBP1968445.1 hypothetical protein [Virgibacillus natechei]UZD13566.1 hypothetical protein OLD84_03140 [Virgibacillus natechei]
MMRYWKLITIMVVVVLSIGSYYIESAITGTNYPEFVFEHHSGNEEEVKNLILDAQYINELKHNMLQVTAEGTKYQNEESYLEGLESHVDDTIKQLQEDYPSFMRGKSEHSLAPFYENETILVYVNQNTNSPDAEKSDFTLDIEVLDKGSGDRTAFTIKLPETKDYQTMRIGDVQVIDGEMKIITRNFLHVAQTGYTSSEEIHVYNLDVANQEVTSNEVIVSNAEPNNATVTYITIINEHGGINQNEYVLVHFDYMETVEHENGSSNLEQIGRELIAYNLETNEQEELDLPEALQDSLHTALLSDSTIYFNKLTETGVEILTYDLNSKEIETEKVLEDTAAFEVEPHMAVKNDNMYLTSKYKYTDSHAAIFVVDLTEGDILYEGAVEMKDQQAEKEEEDVLYIDDMLIE